MRRSLAVIAVVVLALAGCATPAPEPVRPSQPPPVEAASPQQPAPAAAAPPAAREPSYKPPPPFPPEVSADLESLPTPSDDLWDRIKKGYKLPAIDDPNVAKWEEWYSSRPDYVARMVERSRRYLYYIVVEVENRGMPLEIALLPMVESAFNPVALSSSRASGIWQFMPSTGKDWGMKQNWWFDSRRDVLAATDGALSYLAKLYAQFDDWQLALAAYNWGEGNVARAIERNQRAGRPTDYASLAMPDETRNYLPKLQAVKNIVNDPAKYNLELADIPDAPYFAVVKTTKQIDVKRAAELAEMSVEEFRYLNPHHNRPVIAGADEYAILLPIDNAELFAAKLELDDQPLVSWQAYRTRPNETLLQIAARFGMEPDTLRAVNGIGANARVPAGHVLLVPSQQPTPTSADTLKSAVFTTVPQGRTFYYRVNRGDTLPAIAARYAVGPEELRRWNNLTQNRIYVGQRLRITSDLAPNAGTAKRATGAKPALKTVKGHPLTNGAAYATTNGKTNGRTNGKTSAKGNGKTRTAGCCGKGGPASGVAAKSAPAAHR